MQTTQFYSICTYHTGDSSVQTDTLDDIVVCEEPLEIWLEQHSDTHVSQSNLLFTTMRTPGDDINLVKGWLHTSGAIKNDSSIRAVIHTGIGRLKNQTTNRVKVQLVSNVTIDISKYQRFEVANSACGVCGQQSIEDVLEKLSPDVRQYRSEAQSHSLSIHDVYGLTEQLNKQQTIFKQTGGSHGVALFDGNLQLIDSKEDVGRHNALDKLIGANLPLLCQPLGGNEPQHFSLVLSGRVSYELVQKAVMTNIRTIVAIGAPSSLAIDLAKECDICLIGFVKTNKFNLYCGKLAE